MKTLKLLGFAAIASFVSVASAGDPIVLTTEIGKLDATVTQEAAAANGWASAQVVEADGKLTSVTVTVDSSKYDESGAADAAVTAATNALDSVVTHATGADGLAVSVTQTDGKLTAITASIAADTYDAHGAAATAKAEVIGQDGDASTANTIYGAKAYTDAAVEDMSVTASGETGDSALVTASADGKAITVGSTEKLQTAVGLAESAVQTVAEGATDGTIAVDGTDVAVHGLGSAAFEDTTAFDAAGTAATAVTAATNALDATVSHTAGADGVAVTVTQVDGKLTSVTASIAAGTYDADGAAAAVQGDTTETVASVDAKVTALTSDVDTKITAATNALDATVTQTAGADGLALSVTEVDGKLTAVTGSIAANTYDAYGAAAAVQGDTNLTVKALADVVTGVKATADAAVVANDAITAGTHTKITYDAKGLVTGGADLEASDIPALDAAKITSGTFADARIASAATWNAKQDQIIAGTNVTIRADGKTIDVTMDSDDIDARIVNAIKNGITVDGVVYKLVVEGPIE